MPKPASAVLISVALVLLLAASAQATTFTVDRTADTAAGGTCLATPTQCSLRQAIESANGNPGADVIDLSGGTYVLTNGELVVSDQVRVQRVGATRAVVDGNAGGRVFRATAPLTLVGLDVRNGEVHGEGGGIWASAPLTLDDVTVEENMLHGGGSTAGRGAGIFASDDLTLTGSRVLDNFLAGGDAGRGGGIAAEGTGEVTLENVTLANNRVLSGMDASGAGLATTMPLTLRDSTVSRNEARTTIDGIAVGGGLAVRTAAPTVTGTVFIGNRAYGWDGSSAGGGMYVDAPGGGTIDASRFTDNRLFGETGSGGGLTTADGVLVVRRTTFDTNRIETGDQARGGAVAALGSGRLAISAGTIVGNRAVAFGPGPALGGGLHVQASGTTVQSTTITGNIADADGAGAGGGIAGSSDAVSIDVTRSIVAGNLQPEPLADCASATLASGGGNVLNQVDGAAGCRYAEGAADVVTRDPGVGPLTMLAGAPQPVAPLLPGSPAIDRSTTGCAGVDVRGVARPSGPACDSGAVEMRTATFTASSPTLSFGDVVIGTASAPQDLTLTNTGELPGVPSLALAGADPAQFTRSGCDASVAPGAVCTVSVWFSPTRPGPISATLTGASSPIALDGTGVPPAQPDVRPPPSSVLPLPALAQPAQARLPLPPRCAGHELTLVELTRRGDDLAVRGLTRRANAGRIVTLRAGTTILGTVAVRADGAFAATIPAPYGVASGRVKVTAEIAGAVSQPFAVDRRTTIERRKARGGVLTVVARIRGAKARSTVKLERRFGCGPARPYGRVRVGRGGRVTLSLPLPPLGADPVLYRASASVGRGVSYTLPLAVTPQG